MTSFNVEIDESIFSKIFFKNMKEIESRFKHLNLINKKKEKSIRVQIFEKMIVVVAAVKKYKRVKRKLKFSFDSSDFENITTQEKFFVTAFNNTTIKRNSKCSKCQY